MHHLCVWAAVSLALSVLNLHEQLNVCERRSMRFAARHSSPPVWCNGVASSPIAADANTQMQIHCADEQLTEKEKFEAATNRKREKDENWCTLTLRTNRPVHRLQSRIGGLHRHKTNNSDHQLNGLHRQPATTLSLLCLARAIRPPPDR